MAGLGRPRIGWGSAAICGALLWLSTATAFAQFGGQFGQETETTPEQGLLNQLPRETRLTTELFHARESLNSKDYEAAIDTLQPLLEFTEDHFEVEGMKPTGSTLNRVESLLWSMPPEAIETYRRRYEQLAVKQFESARQQGNLAELLAVARTWPLTLAAADAIRTAGEFAFDQGETALAARLWERLLPHMEPGPERVSLLLQITRAWMQANQPVAAAKHLPELNALAQAGPLVDEGRNITPPPMADSAWLDKVFGPATPLIPQRVGDWKFSGGHPRRWGSGEAVSPLLRGFWSYPLIDQYDTFFAPGREGEFQTFLMELEKTYLQGDLFDATKKTPLVIGAPLVVGDTVLVQGLGSVKALDAQTGEIRWSGVVRDDTFLYWTWRNYQSLGSDQLQNRLVAIYLGQRAWLNQTGAALSSDGQQVYSITGTGMIGAHKRQMLMRAGAIPPPQELTPPRENRLLAYDLTTGLLRWECGGPAVAVPRDEDGLQEGGALNLPGAFFLGAPLPVDGQLFTLAEEKGQIRLFSLSPEDGVPNWSLPLLNPEKGIEYDETRRLFGLSPAYAGGLLICPTGEGVVVAVDPLLRRVVWIQQYQYTPRPMNPQNWAMMRMSRDRLQNDSLLNTLIRQRRWLDNSPILTAGRVLLPAAETDKLYCLDMETGSPLWELPRGESLFIAACTDRRFLVVGERTIQAFSLADGKFVWSQEIAPPTGRGVVSGNYYLLPVSSNEILAIEMKTGRIVSRSGLPSSLHAGSLVSSRGRLLMQTTSELIGYRSLTEVQAEIARNLNQPERQAQAMAEKGELLLFQGKEAEAIELLQKSLAIQDSPATRKLYVWSQLEKLKSDYQGSRGLIDELKRTVTDPDQKRLLNQILAEGLEQSGESLAAFREYIELIPSVGRSDALQNVSFDHQVRNDRWLRGRLTRLYELANEAQKQEMLAAIQEALKPLDNSQKQLFARVFGLDLTPELHLQLALVNQFDQFLSQRVLWAMSESPQLQLRGPAVARLLRNQLTLNQLASAGPLLTQLERDLAEVECEQGVTGKELVKRLEEDKRLGPLLSALRKKSESPSVVLSKTPGLMPQREVIRTLGTRRGTFANGIFTMETSPQLAIQLTNSQGRTRQILNLANIPNSNVRPIRYVQTDSQLVLFAYRDQFAVINPFEASGSQYMPRLHGYLSDTRDRFSLTTPDIKQGVRDLIYPNGNSSYQGNVGPLTFDTLCYLSGDELTAVIPYEREFKTVWKRSAVTPGSEICADSEYVVLIPPLLDKLVVLRAADGSKVAERDLPKGRVDRLLADWGRMFFVRRDVPADGATPAKRVWAMYDPALDRDAWSLTLSAGSLWAPVDGEDIALLEPDGTFYLIDDQTGHVRWKTSLPAQPHPVEEFSVHVDESRVFVHTSHKKLDSEPEISEPAISEPTPIGSRYSFRVNGLTIAIDRRDGVVQWSHPMEQQQFRPNFPAGSGVLAYSTLRKQPPGPMGEEYSTEITFLSRQTGEPLLVEKFPGVGSGEAWRQQPDGAMQLQVTGREFVLSWKSDPGKSSSAPEQSEPQPDEPEAPVKLQ
ncbi:MAG: PQQ-binding-like beta-propeller repeat protein [Planctomycetaceae bacterium]